jgi:kynurenine formamidase
MFIEVSYSLEPDKIVMPGNIEKPVVSRRSCISTQCSGEKEENVRYGSYNNTSFVKFFCHTGTHVDVPFHIDNAGFQLQDFDLHDFILSQPLLLEIPKEAFGKITVKDLEPYKNELSRFDALLIYTGFSSFREKDPEAYVTKQPSLTLDAAQYLVDNFNNIRAYGIDTIGIENISQARSASPTPFPVHKILLGKKRKVYIAEDVNLKLLLGRKLKRLFVIPLRIFGVEAMPVVAFAEVEE